MGLADVRGRGADAMAHLAKINGWTAAQAQRYADAEEVRWMQRSQHEWTIDLDALAQYGPPLSPSSRRRRCETCNELFPPNQLTAHDGERLCEDCLDEWLSPSFEMWPDHERPPPGMSEGDDAMLYDGEDIWS
jgi:hypothetical protein